MMRQVTSLATLIVAFCLLPPWLLAQEVTKEQDIPESKEVIEPVGEEKLEDLLSLVSDNSFRIHKREMPAYWELIRIANEKPMEELLAEARSNPRFHDFYTAPSKHRGELIQLALHVKRVIPYPVEVENRADVKQLYELWGWTDEAKAWLYCCITSELPEGFPRSGDVSEKVTLVGYFFKLQAYQPGDAAPGAKPLVAPLVLGRVHRSEAAKEAKAAPQWPLYLLAGFGAIVTLRILMQFRSVTKPVRSRSMYRRRSLEHFDADEISLVLQSKEPKPQAPVE